MPGSRPGITTEKIEGRILTIDRGTADIWGIIIARATAAPVQLPTIDTFVVATAERHRMVVASRNTRDFVHTHIATVNPWEPRARPR
jgi:toxin FitB